MKMQVKKKKYPAFTLVEVLVVLVIICVLVILFVPNVGKQKELADKKSNEALTTLVENQIKIYELEFPEEKGSTVTVKLSQMETLGYITKEQRTRYEATLP